MVNHIWLMDINNRISAIRGEGPASPWAVRMWLPSPVPAKLCKTRPPKKDVREQGVKRHNEWSGALTNHTWPHALTQGVWPCIYQSNEQATMCHHLKKILRSEQRSALVTVDHTAACTTMAAIKRTKLPLKKYQANILTIKVLSLVLVRLLQSSTRGWGG
jgi:hypothetical protein